MAFKMKGFMKENPDVYIYKGTNINEKITGLEDRIEFVRSDIENEVITPMEGGKTITKLKKELKALRDKKNAK